MAFTINLAKKDVICKNQWYDTCLIIIDFSQIYLIKYIIV